jgi:dihydrofolate reductase
MDWLIRDIKNLKYIHRIAQSVDTILMGRKMVNEFIQYWTDVTNKPDDPMYAFAKKMIEIPKVVFTKTLHKSEWMNTKLAKGDLKDEVTQLKYQEGKDILVYGGALLDSSLIKENLIDEFYLFVNPIVMGKGKNIFKDIKEIQKLSLIESKVFDYGLVLLHYEVNKN